MAQNKIVAIQFKAVGSEEILEKLTNLKVQTKQITAEIKELEKAQKKTNDPAQIKAYEQQIQRLIATQGDLKAEYTATNKELNLQRKAFSAVGNAKGSIAGLRAEYNLLNAQLDKLSDADRGSDFGRGLEARAKEIKDTIDDADQRIGNYRGNVGRYADDIVKALRRAGSETAFNDRLDKLNKETVDLEKEAADLAKQYDKTFEQTGEASEAARKKIIKELVAVQDQIKENQSSIKNLNKEIETVGDSGKAGKGDKISGRSVKRAGKLAGLGGLADLAGGAVDLQNILGNLGPAGIAAFGVFAAGGLVFKGIQALTELNKQIGAVRGQVAELSGASGAELEKLTVDVRAIAATFGQSEDEIIQQTKERAKLTGQSFQEALGEIQGAYLETAKATGVFTDQVDAQLAAQKQLAAAQSELANKFNDTGLNLDLLTTNLKTGFFNALIAIYDTIKPIIDIFVDYGKAIGGTISRIFNFSKATTNLGAVFKILTVPVRVLGVLVTKLFEGVNFVIDSFSQFIADSPNIQAVFSAIGDAISLIVEGLSAIPDGVSSFIEAAAGTVRDAASYVTGGLIDDSATAAAKADAREAGRTIAEGLVDRYGEGIKEISVKTQLEIARAGGNAITEALQAGKSLSEAFAAGLRAGDKEASKSNLVAIRKKTVAEIEAENEKLEEAQKEREQKAKQAAQEAANEREKQAKDALERIKEGNAATLSLLKENARKRQDFETQSIKNEFERRAAEINEGSSRELQDFTEASQKAAAEVAKSFETSLQLFDAGGEAAEAIRARYGSKEEIQQAAQEAAQNNEIAIIQQTTLIKNARDKQLAELQQSRDKAIQEAVSGINENVLNDAIQSAQSKVSGQEQQKAIIELGLQLDEQSINSELERLKSSLAAQRDAGIINAKQFQEAINVLENSAAEAQLKIQERRLELTQQTDSQILQSRLELLQKEQEAEINQINSQSKERQAALLKDFGNGLLTLEQYDNERVRISQATAEQILSIQADTAAQSELLRVEQTNAQIAAAQTVAQTEAAINAELQAQIREERQATLDNYAQQAQNLQTIFTETAQIGNDLFTASDNKRKAAIEARYQQELAAAGNSATAAAAAEERKDQALQVIEKQAAERKRKFDIGAAITNGAVAVTNILASTPDPTGIFTLTRIALAAATVAAQIKLINSQQFELGGVLPSGDGMIKGRSHAQGGVKFLVGGRSVEVEGNEYLQTDEYGQRVIINKKSSTNPKYRAILDYVANQSFRGKRALLSQINQMGGGVKFAKGGVVHQPISYPQKFAVGGLLPSFPSNSQQITAQNLDKLVLAITQSVGQVAQQLDANMRAITVQLDTEAATKKGNENIAQNKIITL